VALPVLVVSPHFRPATTRPGSHFVTHSLDLTDGFRACGCAVSLIVPQGQPAPDPDVLPLLDTSDPAALARSISAHLAAADDPRGITVLYEGGLSHLMAFIGLAERFPTERFVLNLFDRDVGLTAERLSSAESRARLSRLRDVPEETITGDIPSNLILTAETQQRALLAGALGLPLDGAWRLHSQLADLAEPFIAGPNSRDPDRLRVLLPLSTWNAEPSLREIGFTVLRTTELLRPGQRIDWTLSGNLDRILGSSDLRRLARLGVKIDHRVRPLEEFAELFRENDLVWLPMRRDCATQSSGKATDALAIGRPILAPAGSYAAHEQSRWLPGFPDYRTVDEIPVLAASAFRLMASADEAFAATAGARRDHFGARSSAAHVLDLVERADGRRDARPFSLPAGSLQQPAPAVRAERWRLRARGLRVGAATRLWFGDAHRH
jgi:hypothetical protein